MTYPAARSKLSIHRQHHQRLHRQQRPPSRLSQAPRLQSPLPCRSMMASRSVFHYGRQSRRRLASGGKRKRFPLRVPTFRRRRKCNVEGRNIYFGIEYVGVKSQNDTIVNSFDFVIGHWPPGIYDVWLLVDADEYLCGKIDVRPPPKLTPEVTTPTVTSTTEPSSSPTTLPGDMQCTLVPRVLKKDGDMQQKGKILGGVAAPNPSGTLCCART